MHVFPIWTLIWTKITILKDFCEFWLSIHQDITIYELFQLSTNFHCSNKQVTLCQTEYFLKHLFVFNWLMTGLQYCFTSVIHQHKLTIGVHMSPPLSLPLTSHPFPPLLVIKHQIVSLKLLTLPWNSCLKVYWNENQTGICSAAKWVLLTDLTHHPV